MAGVEGKLAALRRQQPDLHIYLAYLHSEQMIYVWRRAHWQ